MENFRSCQHHNKHLVFQSIRTWIPFPHQSNDPSQQNPAYKKRPVKINIWASVCYQQWFVLVSDSENSESTITANCSHLPLKTFFFWLPINFGSMKWCPYSLGYSINGLCLNDMWVEDALGPWDSFHFSLQFRFLKDLLSWIFMLVEVEDDVACCLGDTKAVQEVNGIT